MLSLIFIGGIAGCASSNPPLAYKCDKPPLRGETWADIAILSIEQASAIDVCNIRNGVDDFRANATTDGLPFETPSPHECVDVGVSVRSGDIPTGRVVQAHAYDPGRAGTVCGGIDRVGCAIHLGNGRYTIHYERTPWVIKHEVCHALYEEEAHTTMYRISR